MRSRLLSRLLVLAVFGLAAGLAWTIGTMLADGAERLTRSEIDRVLAPSELAWVSARVDGLNVHLDGRAPTEGARLAALRAAAEVVGAGRVSEAIELPRAEARVAPVFRVEAMRNQGDISLIGLVPAAMPAEHLLGRIAALGEGIEVADMLQSADHPEPPGWALALDFAVEALRRLPVAQVSVTAGRIEVHALVDSPDDRQRLTTELRAIAPRGQVLLLDLVAPRPVIAPFLLRLVREGGQARIEACAADSDVTRDAIERAARAAGLTGRFACPVGLGVPSPRWVQAAERSLAAAARLQTVTLTLSDLSVRLESPHDTDPEAFDRVAGRLEAELPEGFALTARLLDPPDEVTPAGAARPDFRVVLEPGGSVAIAGRLPDVLIRQAVEGFARARFGMGAVTMETRLDPDLPAGWSLRVLAGLAGLTELAHGRLTVTETRIDLSGVSGNPEAVSVVNRVLAERLGGLDGVGLRIDYDERLDPVAQEPNPDRCERWVRTILAERKLNFAPGSARLDEASAAIVDDLAERLRACGELPFEVAGHTDSQGSDETNLALSQSRAEAVIAALSARGVLVASMQAQGYGSTRPIADNATAEGREANRRIEMALIRPAPDPDTLDDETRAELEAGLVLEPQTLAEGQTRPAARPARGN